MDKEDYYEYHESKEALAEGQLPSDNEPFTCPLSNAVRKRACCYYKEQHWHDELGVSIDIECLYPGGADKCRFVISPL